MLSNVFFNCYCTYWIYTDRMFVSVTRADLLAHSDQMNSGLTMDKPWNDLKKAWNDLKKSWKDLKRSWTPPPLRIHLKHVLHSTVHEKSPHKGWTDWLRARWKDWKTAWRFETMYMHMRKHGLKLYLVLLRSLQHYIYIYRFQERSHTATRLSLSFPV